MSLAAILKRRAQRIAADRSTDESSRNPVSKRTHSDGPPPTNALQMLFGVVFRSLRSLLNVPRRRRYGDCRGDGGGVGDRRRRCEATRFDEKKTLLSNFRMLERNLKSKNIFQTRAVPPLIIGRVEGARRARMMPRGRRRWRQYRWMDRRNAVQKRVARGPQVTLCERGYDSTTRSTLGILFTCA